MVSSNIDLWLNQTRETSDRNPENPYATNKNQATLHKQTEFHLTTNSCSTVSTWLLNASRFVTSLHRFSRPNCSCPRRVRTISKYPTSSEMRWRRFWTTSNKLPKKIYKWYGNKHSSLRRFLWMDLPFHTDWQHQLVSDFQLWLMMNTHYCNLPLINAFFFNIWPINSG